MLLPSRCSVILARPRTAQNAPPSSRFRPLLPPPPAGCRACAHRPAVTRSAPCGTCLLRPARRSLCSHSNITHFLAAAECTEGFSGRPEGSQLRRARPASTPHTPWSSRRLSACTDRPFGSPASSSPQSSLCCALSHWGPRCGRHLELPHPTVCPPTSPSVSHTRRSPSPRPPLPWLFRSRPARRAVPWFPARQDQRGLCQDVA